MGEDYSTYKPQVGDIFLVDSNKTGAKIVKFLMTGKTIWQHLWWKITGRLEPERPEYYHAGMVINEKEVIEQQGKVQYKDINKILNANKVIIFRADYVSPLEETILWRYATEDMGKGYDILLCFGKLLTWLTGISFFVRKIQADGLEICVSRVAYWYSKIWEDFDLKSHHEVTTKNLYNYCMKNTNWKIVYQK